MGITCTLNKETGHASSPEADRPPVNVPVVPGVELHGVVCEPIFHIYRHLFTFTL